MRILILFFLIALLGWALPGWAGIIVLKNGKKLACVGSYEVKDGFVAYKDKNGNFFRLPVGIVDLEKSSMDEDLGPEKKLKPTSKKDKQQAKKKDRNNKEKSLVDMLEPRGLEPDRHSGRNITDNRIEDYGRRPQPMRYDEYDQQTLRYRLDMAIRSNEPAKVKRLLEEGMDLNRKMNSYQELPLIHAVEHGNEVIIRSLVEAGADINVLNNRGDTALVLCLKSQKPKAQGLALALLNLGANPNIADKASMAPIHLAQQKDDFPMIRALIAARANLNARNSWGDTPLITAIKTNEIETLNALLEAGANVHHPDKEGITPILVAVEEGKTKSVNILAAKGASLNSRYKEDKTPLLVAIKAHNNDMVTQLVNLGASPTFPAKNGTTAAALAIRTGNEQVVNLFLEKGLDPNQPQALVPLAAAASQLKMTRMLLARGGDVDARDANGDPGLVLAARAGYLEMVKLLVSEGADVYLKGAKGLTAYLEAQGEQAEDIKSVIRTKLK